jgi:competence protein ComEC
LKKLIILLTLVFILGFALTLYAQENLKIYFLDVGQGDSSVILSSSGQVVLIDSGPDESLILNYLENLNISHLDLLIASHAHADHIAGMDKIIAKYRPRAFLDSGIPHTTIAYQKMITAIGKYNINYYQGTSRKINLGPLTFTILPPVNPPLKESELNNNSLVIRLDFKDFSCLFTGGIEKKREGQLLNESRNNLKVDILKITHHGSSSGSSPPFIKAVDPETTIISCGKDNQYGHPHQETLTLLQNLGINIYRTDLNGTILVETNGTDYQVSTEKESIRAPPIVKSEIKTSESQEYKYAASKNSDVFHYLSCSDVNSIKSGNLILFKTREEAIASGRRP